MSFPDTLVLLDDANRADGAAHTGAGSTIWQNATLGGGASTLLVTSNTLAAGGADRGALTVASETDFSKIFTMAQVGSSGGYFAYFWRLQSPTTGSWQGYWFIQSGQNWTVNKRVSGTTTQVATVNTGSSLDDAGLICIRVAGSLIQLYRKDSQTGADWELVLAANDSSITAGGVGFLNLDLTTWRVDKIENDVGLGLLFPQTPIIDDFDRVASSPPPGLNWSTLNVIGGASGLYINANELARASSGSTQYSGYLTPDYGPDTEAYCTIKVPPTSLVQVLYVRIQGAGAANPTHYQLSVSNAAGVDQWSLTRTLTGTPTALQVVSGVTPVVVGDKIGVSVIGTTLRMFKYTVSDGVWHQIGENTFDANIVGGGKIGVGFTSMSTSPRIDDFAGGTIGAITGGTLFISPPIMGGIGDFVLPVGGTVSATVRPVSIAVTGDVLAPTIAAQASGVVVAPPAAGVADFVAPSVISDTTPIVPDVATRTRRVVTYPHFKYPFERSGAGNKVGIVEQGTLAHITTQQFHVLVTPLGFRVDLPDFGWPWPEFQTIPIDLVPLEAAIHRWVPDATFSTSEWADTASEAIRHVQVLTEGV